MRKIMVFQHVGHEPLGTLDPMLKAAGFRIRYVNFARDANAVPNIDSYSGLIILGGPMGVYESDKFPHLKLEMQQIERAVERGIPVLGICLGAQLISQVLGGPVRRGGDREFGWCDIHVTDPGTTDPLFAHYGASEKVFQVHQDTFDIPKTAQHLARSDLFDGQAFRYGERVYGLQFHLEADQPMIQRWLKRPENKKWIEESQGRFSEEMIAKETATQITRSLDLSAKTFGNFIEMFNLPDRPLVLGSEHGRPPKGQR